MGAPEFMFRPRALRRSQKSSVQGRSLYSGDISETVGKKGARVELYIHADSLPKPYPGEVHWNVFRVIPTLDKPALVIGLSLNRKTAKHGDYGCDRHMDFVYLPKEIFSPADPPQDCWLGVWW